MSATLNYNRDKTLSSCATNDGTWHPLRLQNTRVQTVVAVCLRLLMAQLLATTLTKLWFQQEL